MNELLALASRFHQMELQALASVNSAALPEDIGFFQGRASAYSDAYQATLSTMRRAESAQ